MTVFMHQDHSFTADLADRVPWPRLTTGGPEHDVLLDGVPLAAVAAAYGTPLQVISETEIRDQARAYRRAFPAADIAYAGKPFLCTTMAQWMMQEGLLLDVCSGGELQLAHAAGVPMSRIIMHGNAKTPHELDLAHRLGVGRIVVDSRTEINQLAALGPCGDGNARQRCCCGLFQDQRSYSPIGRHRPGGSAVRLLADVRSGAGRTRAPVISVRNGKARMLIRRETQDDLMRRDIESTSPQPI